MSSFCGQEPALVGNVISVSINMIILNSFYVS